MKKILLHVAFLLLATVTALAQTITGTVTSAVDNAPIPGASVLVKGKSEGTTTNADGVFTLSLSDPNAVLVFSFIGFKTTEVSVGGRTTFNVMLDEDITNLKKVVVTAFGIAREKKALGYSVSTVSSSDITATGNCNSQEKMSLQ